LTNFISSRFSGWYRWHLRPRGLVAIANHHQKRADQRQVFQGEDHVVETVWRRSCPEIVIVERSDCGKQDQNDGEKSRAEIQGDHQPQMTSVAPAAIASSCENAFRS